QFQGDYTFNRSTGNSWNAPANWNTGVVPLSSEDTLVPAGSDVEISSAASARNLALNAPLHIVSDRLNLAGVLYLNLRIYKSIRVRCIKVVEVKTQQGY